MNLKDNNTIVWTLLLTIAGFSSCRKFVQTDLPKTQLTAENVFTSDALVNGALNGIYSNMQNSNSYAGGDFLSLTYLGGESSDDFLSTSTDDPFYSDNILPNDFNVLTFWSTPYQDIYRANAVLEGLTTAKGVSAPVLQQAEGEAKFVRAFSYFYLVNMFGDVPLITITDYKQNAVAARTPQAQVYQQIITDLKDAQSLLGTDYSTGKGERVRPNKWVATALLARVYLYTGDWADAATQATSVINTSLYKLSSVDSAFLKNSTETIWAFGRTSGNTNEAQLFSASPGASPFLISLQPSSVARFDPADLRLAKWILTTQDYTGTTYFYPYKYKNQSLSPTTEYAIVLRLGEQYLIRAEARAQQGTLTGAGSAASDINAVRARAGLPGTLATTKDDMLLAIENERYFELFSEWAQRWFDLKRTGRAMAVLSSLKAGWQSFKELYPIPQSQIDNDPAMAGQQNPGYH
jgi:starch-binding outer membrane protein, SusD/RagB family